MGQPYPHANNIIVLGVIIESLRCHRDKLLLKLESYKNKPSVIALVEFWLTENDNTLTKNWMYTNQ